MQVNDIVLEMKKLLAQIPLWLDKAAAATKGKYDANLLLQSRLAPDMFPLIRQIQATCDQAKYAVSRTTGKETPANPDTETTIDEAKQRVATVIAYLDTFKASDFDGIESRTVTTPRWEGKAMSASDYLLEHAMPNFFFHLAMTYAILRSHGIDVGKRDFLGKLSFR